MTKMLQVLADLAAGCLPFGEEYQDHRVTRDGEQMLVLSSSRKGERWTTWLCDGASCIIPHFFQVEGDARHDFRRR